MAVETAEDMAAMFHPDDFGVSMVAFSAAPATTPGTLMVVNDTAMAAEQIEGIGFNGIMTTGHIGEQPGSTAQVSMTVPRIIAMRSALPELRQNDEIELPSGQRVVVNDVHYKGELIIIHYHEHW